MNEQRVPSPLDHQEGGDHYKKMPIQPVEFCQRNKLPFCESAVVKYVCRHRDKNGVEDIKKAIHFLELLLQFEYPETDLEKQIEKFIDGRLGLARFQTVDPDRGAFVGKRLGDDLAGAAIAAGDQRGFSCEL